MTNDPRRRIRTIAVGVVADRIARCRGRDAVGNAHGRRQLVTDPHSRDRPLRLRIHDHSRARIDAGQLIVVAIATRQTTAVSAGSGLMQILPRGVFLR
jgi:hypothetical protein